MEKLDLTSTIGALLIGVAFSAALFGVTCTQVFYYFQHYDPDNIIIKATVVLLLVLEALHSIFGLHAMYYYTILNYNNPSSLATPPWSIGMIQGITIGVTAVVQLFYIRRVYFLSRKNVPLVVIISVLAVARITGSLVTTVEFFKLKMLSTFGGSGSFAHLATGSLSLMVATDVVIAASITYYLHTSRSGIEKTDTLINKLMAYTINNGVLTSVFNILVLAFLKSTNTHNALYFAIYQVVANLYTNSMLATLNSRRTLNKGSSLTMNTFQVGAMVSVTTGTPTDDDNTVEFSQNLNKV